MKYLFVLLLSFCSKGLLAQDSLSSIVVHKDPRVDVLVKKQADVNAAIKKAAARTAKGFRLLVVNTNKRDEALAAKTRIYTHFPELKAYLVYQSPYFKLKAGNFKTREEAKQYQASLAAFFPKGVFIINDVIEVTPEKDGGDQKEL
ncbi:MAG TPA: SPOR domain-containing protein [Flavisolibacter sp.]|nr:SPOR domain-containing protein [Flavisolibacter sp.]